MMTAIDGYSRRLMTAAALVGPIVFASFATGTPPKVVKRTLCVYDPAGGAGDVFGLAKDYRIAALADGVDLVPKAYNDERTAAEDFKAKQCHAVLMTATRVRPFHKFSGTFEAIGALSSYNDLRRLIEVLSKPKASSLMRSGEYEIAGVLPGGAVYLLVADRAIDTVGELAGKRIATLTYDGASRFMVQNVGASMVAADIGTFAGMFNNGSVDACYAPATAYQALELYKGLGNKGGVVKYPLAQLTLQLLIRTADFPAGYGQKTRAYFSSQLFDSALGFVKSAEEAIPARQWIDIPREDQARYDEMFRGVRIRLRDVEKVYHPTALKLMRKLRCRNRPDRAECALKQE